MTQTARRGDDASTMRASVLDKRDGRTVAEVRSVPMPPVARGQALIEVRAAALNHLDLHALRRHEADPDAGPQIIGSDAAGVVCELGADSGDWKIGDEVVLNPGLSCGRCEPCLRGEQSECLVFDIVGMGVPGTFAERVVCPAENLYSKPSHLTFEQAAALPLAHLTAWRMLTTRGRFAPGEWVLIHGIGGGVALAALQLAKVGGGRVIVTSSSAEKLRRAADMGADHVVDYSSTPEVAPVVRELTEGRGVDIVIDTVGAATLPASISAVRNGGTVVLCGATTGADGGVNIREVFWRQVSIVGSTMGSHEDFRRMLDAVSAGRLVPEIDSVWRLSRAQGALELMRRGGQIGKIVLTTESEPEAEEERS